MQTIEKAYWTQYGLSIFMDMICNREWEITQKSVAHHQHSQLAVH